VRAKPFPEPPKSTIKHGTIAQEKFWAYRKALPKEFHDRLVFFVYREWPRLDFYRNFTQEQLAEMRAHKMRRPIKYIAKYTDIDPDDWRNHLLRYHGSGIYKILLNDSGVRGNKELVDGSQICSTTVELRDDEFSPVVDLAVLDMADPANGSFINDLRMKGIALPGDAPREDTEDMASSVAVEALAELAKDRQKPQTETATVLSDLLKQSEARHIKDLELAEARHVRDMEALTKRLEKAEINALASKGPSTTQEVIEMARAIVPAPAPPPQDNKMADLLMQMLQSEKTNRLEELRLIDARHAREMEAMNKRLEALDAREAARAAIPLPGAPAPSTGKGGPVDDLLRLMDGAAKLRDKMDGLTESKETPGPWWLEPAVEVGSKLIDAVSTGIHNAAVLKTGAGAPAAPQTTTTQAVPTLQPGQIPQPQGDPEVMRMQMYARMLQNPMMEALQNHVPGHKFAGWIMMQYGEPAYRALVEQGEQGLLKILQAAPDVWTALLPFGTPRLQQFITEALNEEAALEQFAMFRQGQNVTAPPKAAPQPRPAQTADAVPAEGGGRTILRDPSPTTTIVNPADGKPVKVKPPVNGPAVVENTAG
jgi:hypothetical protein